MRIVEISKLDDGITGISTAGEIKFVQEPKEKKTKTGKDYYMQFIVIADDEGDDNSIGVTINVYDDPLTEKDKGSILLIEKAKKDSYEDKKGNTKHTLYTWNSSLEDVAPPAEYVEGWEEEDQTKKEEGAPVSEVDKIFGESPKKPKEEGTLSISGGVISYSDEKIRVETLSSAIDYLRLCFSIPSEMNPAIKCKTPAEFASKFIEIHKWMVRIAKDGYNG